MARPAASPRAIAATATRRRSSWMSLADRQWLRPGLVPGWMVAGRVPSGRAAVWCAAWIGLAAVSARGELGTSVPAGRPAAPLGVAGGVVHHDQPDGEADRHDDGDDDGSEGGSGHVSSSFRERRRWPAPSAEHRLGGLWSARCRWEWWWSCLHGGRPWRPLLALPEGLFVAGSLGGVAHDGYLNTAPPGRKRLGSRLLFRESAEVGYQLTRRVSVSALFDHLSNAGLAHYNQSLNNLGVRVGVTF